MANNILDPEFVSHLKEDYQSAVATRRTIIQVSSEILTLSKQAIFAAHRNELSDAAELLDAAEKMLNKLGGETIVQNKQQYEGSLRAALEEFMEATLFMQFLNAGKFSKIKSLAVPLDHELYIGALSDVTGELQRKAIAAATARDVETVKSIRDAVEEVVSQFIQFDLLSNLRSKFDQAKKNLRSVEEILYELSLRQSL